MYNEQRSEKAIYGNRSHVVRNLKVCPCFPCILGGKEAGPKRQSGLPKVLQNSAEHLGFCRKVLWNVSGLTPEYCGKRPPEQ